MVREVVLARVTVNWMDAKREGNFCHKINDVVTEYVTDLPFGMLSLRFCGHTDQWFSNNRFETPSDLRHRLKGIYF